MIYNKKGLSEVVTTVIFVSLALIAIGIVWAVINGLVQRGAGDVEITEKCLKVDVTPTAVTCNTNHCLVTLNRKAGGDAIAGVKVLFKDVTGTSGTISTSVGNIEPLATVIKDVTIGLAGKTPTKLELNAYLTDTEGKEAVCTKSNSFTIASVVTGCIANSDCADPTPKCKTATNTCVKCLVDADCPTGKPCILSSNTCTA